MSDPSIQIRAYQPSDAAGLERLIEVVDRVDVSLEASSYAITTTAFRNHDPASDRFILEGNNEIIGYAWVGGDRSDRNDGWICIDPAYRRKGHGKELLEQLQRRAGERGATGLMAYLPGREPALEFARKTGFEVKGYACDLRLPGATPRHEVAFPNGWRLEPYSQSLDVARYARILDASYADLWGHGLASLELVQTMLSTLEPQDVFFVVSETGLDIGCAGINSPSVDAPGLAIGHRAPKNYQAVLAAALKYLEPGFDVTLSSWGDRDDTIAGYNELGFVETQRTPLVWRAI